jgi:hypothetical protein
MELTMIDAIGRQVNNALTSVGTMLLILFVADRVYQLMKIHLLTLARREGISRVPLSTDEILGPKPIQLTRLLHASSAEDPGTQPLEGSTS